MEETFDAVVIGGGFAGSSFAALLRRERPEARVLVVERSESFPRKVGESATELSSWFLTQRLRLDRTLALDHLPKHGLRFWFTNDAVHARADATELGNRFQARIPSYHVERAALDEAVYALAEREGAECRRPLRVRDVRFDAGRPARVEFADGSACRARWVIDATGRRAWLARRLDLFRPMPQHPVAGVWARYRGVRDLDDDPARGSGGGVFCSRALSTNHVTGDGWWLWFIPLPGGETSVGLVYDERLCRLPPGDDLGGRLDAFFAAQPVVREMLEGAERTALHALKHLPYRVERSVGHGWAIVGDAAGFLDPLYSPGFDFGALTADASARLVARALGGAEITADLDRHNRQFARGFDRWFEALFRDKYEYLGDFELLRIALRLDTAGYYFGVITPAYRHGPSHVGPPFAAIPAYPFYRYMRFVHRRLVSLARRRRALGLHGARNAGRSDLLPGFVPGAGNLRYFPWALFALARLELRTLWARWRAPTPAPQERAPA